MNLKLIKKFPETSDVTTFVFQPEQELNWIAGQFLHYILEHSPKDERGIERWFTIAAAPSEKVVKITTRLAPEKGSTFKKTLFNLPIGQTIKTDPPEGDFIIENPQKEFVFLSGGIGITPFRAILKDFDTKGIKPKITLLYSNKNQEVIFKEELESFKKNNPNLSIYYLFSPQRIDENTIKQYVKDLKTPIFYVSGPEPMVEAMGQTLKSMGIPQDHIKQDWFPGYPMD